MNFLLPANVALQQCTASTSLTTIFYSNKSKNVYFVKQSGIHNGGAFVPDGDVWRERDGGGGEQRSGKKKMENRTELLHCVESRSWECHVVRMSLLDDVERERVIEWFDVELQHNRFFIFSINEKFNIYFQGRKEIVLKSFYKKSNWITQN